MHYMDDTKRKLLSFEEIAYAKEHGAILEDLSISHEEAIRILTQSLKCISLSDAAHLLKHINYFFHRHFIRYLIFQKFNQAFH